MANIIGKVKKQDKLRISWSAIQSFLSCQRKYQIGYEERLQKIPSADNRNLMLGSAFHAGIEGALKVAFDAAVGQYAMTTPWLVKAAVAASQEYMKTATIKNKMVKSWDAGGMVPDVDYYAMIKEVSALVVELLKYHLPLIGIGDRYVVPSIDDVLGGSAPIGLSHPDVAPVPAIEWHFEYPIDDFTILSGYIDTVLWDTYENDYVIIDWKTRNGFPHDSMALIDGQAHLYAAVVNDFAERSTGATPIHRVIMHQFLTSTPKPASISKKTGLPNTGAESYATTWEVWCATLPRGIKAEQYQDEMMPKMKTDDYWQRPVAGVVTDASSELAIDNVRAAVAAMRAAKNSGLPYPASLSSKSCEWCDFAMLCTNVLRYGGDPSSILNEFYEERP